MMRGEDENGGGGVSNPAFVDDDNNETDLPGAINLGKVGQ